MEQQYFKRPDGLPWSQAIEEVRLREHLERAFQNVYDEQKVIDVGHAATGFITLNVPVADDYFEVGGRVYCYLPTGGVPYDVAIPVADPPSTVSAINGDSDRKVDAYHAGGNLVLFVARVGGVEGNSISTSESTGGARLLVRAGSLEEGKDQIQRKMCTVSFDIKAEDVSALGAGEIIPVMGIPSTSTPEVGSVACLRGGNTFIPLTNAVSFHTTQVNSYFWVVQMGDTGPVFQAGDLLLLLAWV